ncbi:MAG: DNA-directed RNA polymerase subunit alpha C-terminal domain-containing protein [bacterium]
MNNNKKFKNRKVWLIKLLELGMPYEVIEKMLEISHSTSTNYITQLRESGAWQKDIVSINNAKPAILKLYADIKFVNFAPISSWDSDFRVKLDGILAEELEEEKIIQTIRYALPAIVSFNDIIYTDEVSVGYRRLISRLWSRHNDVVSSEIIVWRTYLYKIFVSHLPLPEKREFFWKDDHFIRDVINVSAKEMRSAIAPTLTGYICPIIDEALGKLIQGEKKVIEMYYGIRSDVYPLEDIGKILDIADEYVHHLKDRGIVKLKKSLAHYLKPISNAWEDEQSYKASYEQEMKVIKQKMLNLEESYKKQFLDVYETEIHAITEYNQDLVARIVDIDFHIRIINCCKNAGIEYVWQLVQYTPYEFLKHRNLGKKSHNEIETYLKKKKLNFGMRFSDVQIGYFKLQSK